MKHSLFSHDQDMPIAWFDKFDAAAIKEGIIKHLTDNPTDTIEHCKEYSKEDIKKYYGMEIISFYRCNKGGIPSKVILKGDKEFTKPLI
jgi:hypothetical protein